MVSRFIDGSSADERALTRALDNREPLANGANSIFYRVETDPLVLTQISTDINTAFGTSSFSATDAVIATWFKVAKWKRSTDLLNTFQVVLATSGSESYVIFYYNRKYSDYIARQD